jgi:hypothetical protein
MWLAGYAFSNGMRLKYSEGLIKDNVSIAEEDEKEVFSTLGLTFPMPTEPDVASGKPIWKTNE